jgi:hypothetical protein
VRWVQYYYSIPKQRWWQGAGGSEKRLDSGGLFWYNVEIIYKKGVDFP